MKKIILIGFAACGKSSVGRLLADRLGCEFVDTDGELERVSNLAVSDIFKLYGEERFRQLESELLASLTDRINVVISCGGGSVLVDSFQSFAAHSTAVLLTATAQTVRDRLNGFTRPLFDRLSVQELDECIERRSHIYQGYADVEFSTDGKTPEQVGEEIYNYIIK